MSLRSGPSMLAKVALASTVRIQPQSDPRRPSRPLVRHRNDLSAGAPNPCDYRILRPSGPLKGRVCRFRCVVTFRQTGPRVARSNPFSAPEPTRTWHSSTSDKNACRNWLNPEPTSWLPPRSPRPGGQRLRAASFSPDLAPSAQRDASPPREHLSASVDYPRRLCATFRAAPPSRTK